VKIILQRVKRGYPPADKGQANGNAKKRKKKTTAGGKRKKRKHGGGDQLE